MKKRLMAKSNIWQRKLWRYRESSGSIGIRRKTFDKREKAAAPKVMKKRHRHRSMATGQTCFIISLCLSFSRRGVGVVMIGDIAGWSLRTNGMA